ncbi:Fur family transcriptional regulator [Cellulomonas aerilata]|uniref:Transcriptional repressor n=1 Tax=Cellulomonas aerilata TaxID=515326 RepID=A0A512DC85_9CELL|nr:Fur family transcriptional regulator [Cellulomonas aerilata]GEO34063.1 transcriptional repressor [Cellulomonas aerilata]
MAVQRSTRQRAAIESLLADVDDFRSAQQLHELLGARGERTGLATVYRTLQSLTDEGEVDALRTTSGELVYRRCEQRSHHHHLVCRVCGRTVEVEGPGVEAWATAVGAEHGFADIEHTLELVGTCSACAAREPGRGATGR